MGVIWIFSWNYTMQNNIARYSANKQIMHILHRNGFLFPKFKGFLVPSCCKDYLLGKELYHLVSEKSTLHQVTRLRVTIYGVTLFEAQSRIFLHIAQSCVVLFCCHLTILGSLLGWFNGNNTWQWWMRYQANFQTSNVNNTLLNKVKQV